MSAEQVSASGVEAPLKITHRKSSLPNLNNAADIPGKLDYNQFIASGTNSRNERLLTSSRTDSTASTLAKLYTELSKEEKVYICCMAIGTLPFLWHLIWTLLEACISSVDYTGRLITTVFAVLGSPFLLWATLGTAFPVRIRVTSFIANRCNRLIVILELLRGYFFTLLCLWEMATSGPAKVFGFVLAIISFVCFLTLGGLFWFCIEGCGFDGAYCSLDSILDYEEEKKRNGKKREEKEEKKYRIK